MQFTDIFIRRPVFATVLSLIVLLVGLKAFFSLPVRQYPNISPSVITVTTNYPGATAQLMEGFVSTPLEGALGSVEGLDFMTSTSTLSSSTITLTFKLGYDINRAIADTTNAVSSVRFKLPQQINDPIIQKQDPSAQPTMYIVFSNKRMGPEAITDYLARVVTPQLQIVPGVSKVEIFGSREYAMRIWLDPNRMAAHNVTAEDVMHALVVNNVQTAPGKLKSFSDETAIYARTDLNNAAEFNQLVVTDKNGYLIRIGDIGEAKLGVNSDSVSINMNGDKNSVVVGVIPQSTANPLEISKGVNATLPSIHETAPAGMSVKTIWDTSKFISASLSQVNHTIFEAAVFVIIVIFLFLGSVRSVLIPVVTIPLSLIGVCAVMLALGYSINTLTLLAWVLAIGLVVDDAIVVLENIHRHIELGQSPFNAALIGAREIGFAVIAMTITLAAVYTPIGFMTDLTGQLFREFAFTLAASVVISGFVALTLSPMMCSKILKHEVSKTGLVAKADEIFNTLMLKYKNLLTTVLNKRKLILVIGGIVYLCAYLLYITTPSELAPEEDQGAILGIVLGPTAANLNYIEKYTDQLQNIYKSVPEMEGYGIINGWPGVNGALSFLVLKPWEERKRTVNEIIPTLYPGFFSITGVRAFPINLPPLPVTGGNTPVEFQLKTIGDYSDLYKLVQKIIVQASQENPGLLNLDTDLKLDKPQLMIEINRSKANALGVSMGDIGNALNTLLGEPNNNRFEMTGRSYYVIPQIFRKEMMTPDQLKNINLRTSTGQLVPLSNLVTMHVGPAPQSLNHFQQLRSAKITASLPPGYALGDALDYLKKVAKHHMPANTQFDFSGQSRQFMDASGSMQQTFLFAVIFIFLVLAAQFESFRDPLIVMMSVPLSLAGALLAMHVTHASLNIYTQIGLITLIGLITKHGILIVEFANQIQESGKSISEAVVEAAALRLRPILMTTGAMLLGALPLALASGAGATSRQQLGWVIFGGMSVGTLFTLFIIPVVYTILATKVEKQEEAKNVR